MKIRKLLRVTYKELTASPILPAIFVFLTMLVFIGSAWRTAEQDVEKTRSNLVEERAVLSENNVLQEVYSYENALLASRGLILSSDDVDRDEWKSFVGALRLAERRRGMLGIGFAVGILYAPRKGSETQAKLKARIDEIKNEVENKTQKAKSKIENMKKDKSEKELEKVDRKISEAADSLLP